MPYYRQILPILNLFKNKNLNSGDKIDYAQRKKAGSDHTTHPPTRGQTATAHHTLSRSVTALFQSVSLSLSLSHVFTHTHSAY